MIQISEARVPPGAAELIETVLSSGQLSQGPMVETFEQGIAALVGMDHAVAVSSGTAALAAALEAHGIGPGDEVVLPAFTFVATLNAVLEVGAVARFADIRLDDFTIDPEAVEALVTPATAAVMPVHLYGQPADMQAVGRVAARHGLLIVEDAAQALGATSMERPVGSFGTACFSFYATKNLTTGEGGMVTTADVRVARRVRLLRNQGMDHRYEYLIVGRNLRMTELQAALGVSQLRGYDRSVCQRRDNAATLANSLAGLAGVVTPAIQSGSTHVFHQFTVRITPEARATRERVIAVLARQGVATGIYYPRPVYDYACFLDHPGVHVNEAHRAVKASREVLSLPIHPYLSADDLEQIADAMHSALE